MIIYFKRKKKYAKWRGSGGSEWKNNKKKIKNLKLRRAYFDNFTRMRFMWIEFNGYTEHIQIKSAHFMSQCANEHNFKLWLCHCNYHTAATTLLIVKENDAIVANCFDLTEKKVINKWSKENWSVKRNDRNDFPRIISKRKPFGAFFKLSTITISHFDFNVRIYCLHAWIGILFHCLTRIQNKLHGNCRQYVLSFRIFCAHYSAMRLMR